jgi:hypothetical protein
LLNRFTVIFNPPYPYVTTHHHLLLLSCGRDIAYITIASCSYR